MNTVFIMFFIFVIIIASRRSVKCSKQNNKFSFKEFFKDTLRGAAISIFLIGLLLIGFWIFEKFIK